MDIQIKRAYEAPSPSDGTRVLVDRLWPRGVKKEALQAEWMKDVAPSSELREWFGHDPERWEGFLKRYYDELKTKPKAVQQLLDIAHRGRLTLVYGAKDEEHNQAAVLKKYLEQQAS